LTPTEQKYTYAQSMQLEGQTGTIGHAVDSRMKSKGILSNFSLLTYYAEMCDMDKTHISPY
ncbi:hypothetical protein GT568_13580, partial [Coprococcus sp. BIOML-A1]|nr:hypothetical protein [Coprococcus sp. BIOML-A1]MZK64943.1 hypothetical protein [Coprococcus sp. BIOML-A2]